MTRKKRNILLALFLAVIPVLSYNYFLYDFLGSDTVKDLMDNEKNHRVKISSKTVKKP
ncbi:MAG: hypothetical protein K0U68_16320 [Gammaproteobacteria bacterium]|nr:hypothetical protein [Gammaproteobacteria bacterium]